MKGGSLAMSAGADNAIFGPIWSSCIQCDQIGRKFPQRFLSMGDCDFLIQEHRIYIN
jgi:hypothetical protein